MMIIYSRKDVLRRNITPTVLPEIDHPTRHKSYFPLSSLRKFNQIRLFIGRLLTYMATLDELAEQGAIDRLGQGVTPANRQVWATTRVINWLSTEMRERKPMPGDLGETPRSLASQVVVLLERFIMGKQMFPQDDFWVMRPEKHDVYELKSVDIRFFGWFPEKGIYLIDGVETMERCHTYNLHDGFRNQVVTTRAQMNIPTGWVSGARPEDAF